MILTVVGSDKRLAVRPRRLIVAGYTGRDTAAVSAHIAELAAIGVPPPATVPAFYDLDPALITTQEVVEVDGPVTSGEVEPVLIRHNGRYLLTVGSDHTDRELERTEIAKAKAACPKPVSARVLDLGTEVSTLPWDEISYEASVDGAEYQRGTGATLLPPADLLARMTRVLGPITDDLALFCGTFPLLGEGFVYGERWSMRLRLPDGRGVTREYRVKQRSR